MTTTALPHPAEPQLLTVRRPRAGDPRQHPRRLLRAVRGRLFRWTVPPGVVLLGLCLLHVRIAHEVEAVGRQLWDAHQLKARLEQERAELTLERETFRDHARVVAEARRKFALGNARKGQIIEVR